MKRAGQLLMGVALLWGLFLAAGGEPEQKATAPVAALLGLGFALWTTAGVRAGSIRGSNRPISRDQQPIAFRVAAALYYTVAGVMLVGALVLFNR